MTKVLLSMCVFAMLGGCTQASDFRALKMYLEQTSRAEIEARVLYQKLKSVYEPLDKRIPYLVSMTESKEPTDVVAAYVALSELCAQVRMSPTPQGNAYVERIRPKELFDRLDSFDASSLSDNWQMWFKLAHRNMKRSLEPAAVRDDLMQGDGVVSH